MEAQLSFSVNSLFTLLPRTTRAADLRVRESAWLGFGDGLGRSSPNLSPSTESSQPFPSSTAPPRIAPQRYRRAHASQVTPLVSPSRRPNRGQGWPDAPNAARCSRFRAQPSADLLPCIAKHHHDLRSDQNAESRTHNQHDTDSDVMQIAWAFVPIALSGPSSHNPCRCPHIQKNDSGIDDQTSPEGHAAKTKAVRPRQTYYIAAKAVMSGEPYVGVGRGQR
jgi:hypothetical protein